MALHATITAKSMAFHNGNKEEVCSDAVSHAVW